MTVDELKKFVASQAEENPQFCDLQILEVYVENWDCDGCQLTKSDLEDYALACEEHFGEMGKSAFWHYYNAAKEEMEKGNGKEVVI